MTDLIEQLKIAMSENKQLRQELSQKQRASMLADKHANDLMIHVNDLKDTHDEIISVLKKEVSWYRKSIYDLVMMYVADFDEKQRILKENNLI